MKRKILLAASLSSAFILASCGASDISSTLFMQSGAVKLNYNISSELTSSSKISGNLEKTDSATLSDSYYFGYTFSQPKMSSTDFSCQAFYVFQKSSLEENNSVSFEASLDLEKVFPKDSETMTVYFVVYQSDFSFSDLATYSYSTISYSWDNDKVKIA